MARTGLSGRLQGVCSGAGFSAVGMITLPLALADVGEAPRHEVAGVGFRRCRRLYGDLPLTQERAVIAEEGRHASPGAGDGARCGAEGGSGVV